MNELHKAVLSKHSAELVKDMIVSETLIGAMYQKRIFEQEHVETIRSCRTPSEQIYKILELLPKRGPDAFPSFMEILQEQYGWLAQTLKESLVTENERLLALQQEKLQTKKEEDNVFTPRAAPSLISLDYDIKSRTSAFVQRQFGQVRRISNTDKKAIERWMGEWLQIERKQLAKAFDNANTALAQTDICQNEEVKEKIFTLYLYIITKLKKPKRKINAKPLEQDTSLHTDTADVEKVNIGAMEREIAVEDADFDLLWSEIDELFTDYRGLEKQVNKSMDYIGGRGSDRELSLLVHDLCGEYRLREKELVRERKKIEEMLVELYNYSTETNKIQHALKNQEAELVEYQEYINKLKQENIELIKEITILEKARLGHMEKEKTLEQLKQTKEDLQTLIQVVNQENKELKQMIQGGKGSMKYGVRGFQNRKSLTNLNTAGTSRATGTNPPNNPQRQAQRKPVPKKRSNSMRY